MYLNKTVNSSGFIAITHFHTRVISTVLGEEVSTHPTVLSSSWGFSGITSGYKFPLETRWVGHGVRRGIKRRLGWSLIQYLVRRQWSWSRQVRGGSSDPQTSRRVVMQVFVSHWKCDQIVGGARLTTLPGWPLSSDVENWEDRSPRRTRHLSSFFITKTGHEFKQGTVNTGSPFREEKGLGVRGVLEDSVLNLLYLRLSLTF